MLNEQSASGHFHVDWTFGIEEGPSFLCEDEEWGLRKALGHTLYPGEGERPWPRISREGQLWCPDCGPPVGSRSTSSQRRKMSRGTKPVTDRRPRSTELCPAVLV